MHLVLEQVVKDTVPLDAEHHGPVWGGVACSSWGALFKWQGEHKICSVASHPLNKIYDTHHKRQHLLQLWGGEEYLLERDYGWFGKTQKL